MEGAHTHTLEDILARISQQPRSTVFIFPSHLFEHQGFRRILEECHADGRKFQIQLSLGAEFLDYQKHFFSFIGDPISTSFLGLELAIDRKLNAVHIEQIQSLENAGIPFSFLCVPKSDLQPVSFLREFPHVWLDRVSLFFPRGSGEFHTALSNEEIFLLRKKLEEQRPEFPFFMNRHMVQYFFNRNCDPSYSAQYRADPSEESFLRLYPLLGKNLLVRKLSFALFRNPFFSPVLILPYGFFWILHDPISALSMPIRFLRRPMILFYKLFDLSVWLFYRFLEIFWLLRHVSIMFYIFCWRAFTKIQITSIQLYYVFVPPVTAFLRQPLWHLEHWFPRLYPAFTYPWKKIYWFLEFQIRKRLLGSVMEKDA